MYQADLIGIETIDKMNTAGVDAGTAAITLMLLGFNSLEQALPEVQFNSLTLAEQKIAEHRKRLEAEGHEPCDLWEELNQGKSF